VSERVAIVADRSRTRRACQPAVAERPEAGCYPAMRFDKAVDLYVADMRRYGRINSDRTETNYRARLETHAGDVGNRDPRTVGRNDIKRTLSRWDHPNTQRNAHAILISFYDWAMEEGVRKDNPARQVRKARKRETSVYRLTREEVVRIIDACQTTRERRLIVVGFTAGARNQELRGMRGEHFQRDGFIWFSPDIAKRGRERWVPVLSEAQRVSRRYAATLGLTSSFSPLAAHPTRHGTLSGTSTLTGLRVRRRSGARSKMLPPGHASGLASIRI
jgi:integrase